MFSVIASFFYRLSLLFIAFWDAENVHHAFLRFLSLWGRAARSPVVGGPSRILLGNTQAPESKIELWGLEFKNRVGLAAGLDKNAEAIEGLQLLDFSFLEVGTVTPKGQAGNPRPRLFRSYRKQILFNAMGFNNRGVDELKRNIDLARPHLRSDLILGVNIGKNAFTSLEDAWRDYAHCARELVGHAHYLTVNVSSPNTQGLRGLQNFTALEPILDGVFQECAKAPRSLPVLVKLAPEIDENMMAEVIGAVEERFPVAGWILTNTLQRETPFKKASRPVGGVSGAPLVEASREALRIAKKYSKKTLVSSGGILDLTEARHRLELGASLVQIYSGLIFRGPSLIRELARKL